jgi:hypothetical protein
MMASWEKWRNTMEQSFFEGDEYNKESLMVLKKHLASDFEEIDDAIECDDRGALEIMIQQLIAHAMEMAYWSGGNALEAIKSGVDQYMINDEEENCQCCGLYFKELVM